MKTRVLVLAGGRGKRMNQPFAKVLTPFHGKPLVVHLLHAIKESGVDEKPTIVLGFDRDKVRAELGEHYSYAIQEEQLGTGHAVRCAEHILKGVSDAVLVLYGDHPFLKPETIRSIVKLHEEKKPVITMATVTVSDFEDWRSAFDDFGRIVRDEKNHITRIVEKKDATESEREIKEINPSFFCFDSKWLWENLPNIGNQNAQKEYYLTDLIQIAISERRAIASFAVDPKESLGVNTKEHLDFAHRNKAK